MVLITAGMLLETQNSVVQDIHKISHLKVIISQKNKIDYKYKVEVVGFFYISGQVSQTCKMKAKALRSYICDFRTHRKLLYLLSYFGSTYN